MEKRGGGDAATRWKWPPELSDGEEGRAVVGRISGRASLNGGGRDRRRRRRRVFLEEEKRVTTMGEGGGEGKGRQRQKKGQEQNGFPTSDTASPIFSFFFFFGGGLRAEGTYHLGDSWSTSFLELSDPSSLLTFALFFFWGPTSISRPIKKIFSPQMTWGC